MHLEFDSNFSLDETQGIVKGLAVPVNKICGDCRKLKFNENSLKMNTNKKVPLYANHSQDVTNIYGKVHFYDLNKEGLLFEASLYIDRIDVKENLLPPLKDKLLKGVSIGVDINKYIYDPKKDEVEVTDCNITELSLVHSPAFKEAQVKDFFNKEEEVGFFFGLTDEKKIEYLNDIKEIKEISNLFKYLGFSNKHSNIIISKIKEFRNENSQNVMNDNSRREDFKQNFIKNINYIKEKYGNK